MRAYGVTNFSDPDSTAISGESLTMPASERPDGPGPVSRTGARADPVDSIDAQARASPAYARRGPSALGLARARHVVNLASMLTTTTSAFHSR
jgi:hypothetical protein